MKTFIADSGLTGKDPSGMIVAAAKKNIPGGIA